MKPNFESRVKRHTAFVVLFAWLFGLAFGTANACLIEPRGTHTHRAVAASALATAEMDETGTALDQVVGAVRHHHHDSDAPGTPCQKLCDEGSKSLPKQQSASAAIDSGLEPFVVVAWTASEATIVSALSRARTQEFPPPRLSVRVRFARLVI